MKITLAVVGKIKEKYFTMQLMNIAKDWEDMSSWRL